MTIEQQTSKERELVPLQLPEAVLGFALPEAERQVEAPNFTENVASLERKAAAGIETPRGTEVYAFRAGIEVEFALYDPTKVKAYLEAEGRTERERIVTLEKMRNPDRLESHIVDDEAMLAPYRNQAREMILGLHAKDEAEEARRQEWLEQVDSLSVRDLLNFRLYSEFSHPTLGDVTPPNGTLQELDEFTERQGWLEFRFGKGMLQTGYYDNEGMSEIRIAPTQPSEALRRRKIVMGRAIELANEWGLLLASDHHSEHPNLSAYTAAEDGEMLPVIGLDESVQARTLDATSGITAAYEDGVFLHAKDIVHDFNFGPYSSQIMEVGPTRKSLRLLRGRVELRAKFYDAEQGVNALMAGMIYGLEQGSEALRAAGHATTEVVDTFKVNRADGFVKERDIQLQRAFENTKQNEDGSFKLDIGWNTVRGQRLLEQLVGKVDDDYGADALNDLVFSAARLDSDGRPYVTAEKLAAVYTTFSDFLKGAVQKFIPAGGVDQLVPLLNERLAMVRLQKVPAIKGAAKYNTTSREEGIDRVRTSKIAMLAYQGKQAEAAEWLRQGQVVYDYLRVKL